MTQLTTSQARDKIRELLKQAEAYEADSDVTLEETHERMYAIYDAAATHLGELLDNHDEALGRIQDADPAGLDRSDYVMSVEDDETRGARIAREIKSFAESLGVAP
jgi:hypothetical protein